MRESEDKIAQLDQLAERDGVQRSEIVRRLIDYGLAHMPAGWQPEASAK